MAPGPSNRGYPILFLAYALIAYLIFLLAFCYAIGFVGGYLVPKAIDSGPVEPAGRSILINLVLLSLFAIQHTIMARPAFKRAWTKIVPPPIERATFVAAASLLLLLLYWQWRPLPETVWHIQNAAVAGLLTILYFAGWALVLYAGFCIDHFDLFGLRQVVLHLRNQPYHHPGFATPLIYRLVRNPLMLGFLIAFWSAPHMSQGRLLFAAVTTGYIFFGIHLEERDLLGFLGEDYRRYRQRTPMILPIRFGGARE